MSQNILNSSLSRRKYIGLVYITPWLIGLILFQLYPLISSLFYSFTDYRLLKSPNWIGIKNYVEILTNDKNFWISIRVTLVYVLVTVPLKLLFALFVAGLMNNNLRLVNLYRTVYYLPSILGGSVAVSLLWRTLFMSNGLVNYLFSTLGLPNMAWLGNPKISLFTLSLLNVWQFGSSMVLFLAGLQQIPKGLYEAARVDGASSVRMFFRITLPLLSPIMLFNLIMQTINTFQEFTAAFVITNGGPMKSTYLYGMMLYQTGFQFHRMGYASALSWILFLLIIVATLLIFAAAKGKVFYTDENLS